MVSNGGTNQSAAARGGLLLPPSSTDTGIYSGICYSISFDLSSVGWIRVLVHSSHFGSLEALIPTAFCLFNIRLGNFFVSS